MMIRRKIKELIADGAIVALQDGNHGEKHPTAADYVDDGIPFLMARDFRDGQIDLAGACKIPKSLGDSLRIGFARTGDVLLTHKGTVGLVAIVPPVSDYVMLTPQVTYYRTDPTKLLNGYLKYALQAPFFRDQLTSFSAQSTRPYIGITAQKELQLDFPPLPVQRRIASILSAYDELIENNQRRIRIMEEMARSLHREWFALFRYPGHESVPLIDSPLGQIPQGWEAKKIAELVAKVSRQGKIKTQDCLQTGDLPVVDQGRELVGGYTNDADVEYSGELPVIVFGDHTRILKFIDFPFACGADGTQLLRSNDERMPVSLFYYTLSAIELSDFAYARHFKFLKEELVVVPIAEVASAFSERVDPIKRQVRILQQQSDNLRRTRDLLLPRLLSGQVALNAIEPELDRVMS